MAEWGTYLAFGNAHVNNSSSSLSEIDEAISLLNIAKNTSLKHLLQNHVDTLKKKQKLDTQNVLHPTVSQVASASQETKPVNIVPEKRKIIEGTGTYIPVEDFAWDQDGFSAPIISIYIDLPGVGKVKQNCDITFSRMGFDFKVTGLDGKNYRLVKDNLEKDIIPEESKMIVKQNRVILKLQKVKGEYSYDHWNNLTAKKPRDVTAEQSKKKDPMGGIMDMMKDMYDEGDENMKKIIAEAMMKSQRGEKPSPPNMPPF